MGEKKERDREKNNYIEIKQQDSLKKKTVNDYIKEKKNTLLQMTMKTQQFKNLWDATKAILRRL